MFATKVVMLERVAEIVTSSTPLIIGAVLLGSIAAAVLIDILRRFSRPTDPASTRARDEGETAVVSALGAFMSGAFYFAVYIGVGLLIVVFIALLIDYIT
jgi:hypothetical protein